MIELSGVNLQAAKQHKIEDDIPEALLHSVPPPAVQDEPEEERADLADTEEAGGGGLAGDVGDEGEVPEVEELRVPHRSGDALPIGECHAAPGSLVRKLLRWEVKNLRGAQDPRQDTRYMRGTKMNMWSCRREREIVRRDGLGHRRP